MIQKIVLFIIIFLSSHSLYGDQLQKVTLELLWKHQFEFAGYYMAIEKGFYKEAGIEVELKEYDFGTNISKDVNDGKAEFGIGRSSLVLDKIIGLDVYLLMPVLQNSPFVLMCKKRPDIKNISDLKGKKIMATQSHIAMASLNAMFKVNQMTNKDFTEISHSFNIQDLIDGKTDAMSVYLTNEPYFMIEKNLEYTIFNPSDYGFNFYEDILFTSSKFEKNNPKLVKKFLEASQKGWEYAYSNVDETANVIFQKYNTQHKTLDHLIYEGTALKKMSKFGQKEFLKFKPEVLSQIIQTYNLLDISKTTVDFDQIIYPDAFYKEVDINFTLMIKIAFGVFLLIIGFTIWNRKLSKLNHTIKESQEKISLLLNNAGQGFLTFQDDFKIDNEYSKECEKLLLEDQLATKDIAKILFQDPKKEQFFKSTLLNALHEEMQIKRNAYLSLLPNTILLYKKAIQLEYKIIENKTIMMILTNITTQKKLENKIKKEQELFKMIVAIASESDVFYEVIYEYEEFIQSEIDCSHIDELYRTIHTFKGLFAQFYMEDIVKSLHAIESKIAILIENDLNNIDTLEELVKDHDFVSSFEATKKSIVTILGDDFLKHRNFIKVDLENISNIQEKMTQLLKKQEVITPECEELLYKIETLSKLSLYSLLKPYILMVEQLAKRFEKDVDELIIDGDKNLLVDETMKPFIKSLIHVFRNSLDHGIETAEERIENHKEEMGTIMCQFKIYKGDLQLIIEDDGAGIDIEKVKEKAIAKGINIDSMDDEMIEKLIFNDYFTTKEDVSEISGRGIGMSAVKSELIKLGGTLQVISHKGEGTRFVFQIPLSNNNRSTTII